MTEIHTLSGAYAVDALDDLERARFERHLDECAACREEVDSLRDAAALLSEPEAITPPATLRDRVLADIGTVRPLPPVVARHVPAPAARRTPLRSLLVAAAAAVVLVVGLVAWRPWHDDGTLSVADTILAAPDAVRVTEKVPGGNGAALTLVASRSLNRAAMIGDKVPEPAEGTTYQLWLQQPGQGMVSAGLMPDSHETTVLTGQLTTATAAAITVEPAGGSDHPSSKPIVVFPLPDPGATSGVSS